MSKICKICGSNDIKIKIKNAFLDKDLLACEICKFEWLEIKQEEVKSLYNEEYFNGESNGSVFKASNFNLPLNQSKIYALKRISSYLNDIENVLEIGPSTSGGMIKNFIKKADTLDVIEISDEGCEFLRSKGLNVFCGDIKDYKTNKKYDLIIATEVVEHVDNPELFIKSIKSLLSSKGVLFISTGNTSSLVKKIQGKRWRFYEFPFHISFFNRINFLKLLEKNGMRVREYSTLGFSWIEKLIRFRLGFLIRPLSKLQITTGMYFIVSINNE